MNSQPQTGVGMLTKEQVERALPANLRGAATDSLVDALNTIATGDPVAAEEVRANFITYSSVLTEGRFKMEDYLNAVVYVTHKILGRTNLQAWQLTFPARYQELMARGTTQKDLSAYAASYNRNKIVNLVYERTMIPTWVLNQDVYQEAINQAVDLIKTSTNDMARASAINSLLTHLKKPEVKEFQVSMEVKESSGMKEMKEALRQMAEQQQSLVRNGATVKALASQTIVEGEYTDVDQADTG